MTYTDPIPANYDSSSISVDPGGLNTCAETISAQVDDISSYLKTINDTLSGLALSWAGSAADQASAYNEKWDNAVQAIFGTKSDPKSGALNILMSGLSKAAQNYSAIELAIAKTFNQYAGGFPAESASTASMSVDFAPAPGSSSSSHAETWNPADGSPSVFPSPVWDDPTQPAGPDKTDMYHTTSVNED